MMKAQGFLTVLLLVSSSSYAAAQTPFQTLKNLYQSSQTAATAADFSTYPGTNTLQCWQADENAKSNSDLVQAYIGTATTTNGGPLFPGKTLVFYTDFPLPWDVTTDPGYFQRNVTNSTSAQGLAVFDKTYPNYTLYLRKSGQYIAGRVSGTNFDSYLYCFAAAEPAPTPGQ